MHKYMFYQTNKKHSQDEGNLPVPSVWSLVGPVDCDPVGPWVRVQSNLSSCACCHLQKPLSKLQSYTVGAANEHKPMSAVSSVCTSFWCNGIWLDLLRPVCIPLCCIHLCLQQSHKSDSSKQTVSQILKSLTSWTSVALSVLFTVVYHILALCELQSRLSVKS